jgi:phosphatidylinositol-bisphosphatase
MDLKNVYIKGLKVLVVTWNVNAKVELESKISDLFKPLDLDESDEDTAEVIVVCFQEVVELSPSNVVIGKSQDQVDQWEAVVSQALSGYEKIASNSMVGLWMGIYAIPEIKIFITELQVGSFARGIGGVLGNKGAVLIRFKIFDSSICFINSHFAAHRENVLKRNEDFHAILMHDTFPDYLREKACSVTNNTIQTPLSAELEMRAKEFKKRQLLSRATSGINSQEVSKKSSAREALADNREKNDKYLSPDDHDIIIWAGDLNYRIIPGIETSKVYEIIREGKALLLAPYDQLNQERESGSVFQGFHEGLLTFEPTYKYIPGTDLFDDRKDKKLRCPSWCDRILWRIGRGLGERHTLSTCSDSFGIDSAVGVATLRSL